MAKVKILARHLKPELNTGTTLLPVWTPIGGLNSLTFSTEKTDTDDTDFDSDGNAEHKVAQRARSISAEGFYKEDPDTGELDAGQEALVALGEAIGYDSLKTMRVTTPGGNVTEYDVSANVTSPSGGGLNDNAGFTAELTVSGAPRFTPAA
ncbi:hypothetical protein [Blastococcus sp. CT_GayMR16]|uniref:phage tail tube protein n=1 Tax=Blastococcus sp. CT_GayMR16 TaxID=2559607 RepID=UPI0010735D51|nr:hypothetical protein [Blastococcus sp. CT_GayMR16]TFV91408.1 hypothetical protein E4P38_02130 [Blastococcus sp. CT_GayMR16]